MPWRSWQIWIPFFKMGNRRNTAKITIKAKAFFPVNRTIRNDWKNQLWLFIIPPLAGPDCCTVGKLKCNQAASDKNIYQITMQRSFPALLRDRLFLRMTSKSHYILQSSKTFEESKNYQSKANLLQVQTLVSYAAAEFFKSFISNSSRWSSILLPNWQMTYCVRGWCVFQTPLCFQKANWQGTQLPR